MAKGNYLGEFEQVVLLAVVRLGNEAYGMTVRREIAERTGRNVSIGAVYVTLDRLEEKGYVKSWSGDPTLARGGRAKRFFRIQAAGATALRESREALAAMESGLAPNWGNVCALRHLTLRTF